MAQRSFREIVIMVLAVLVGLGILLLISNRLILAMASPILSGNGGSTFVVSGISVKLLAMLIVAVVAFVIVLAVLVWRR
jgi:hypothetical protein